MMAVEGLDKAELLRLAEKRNELVTDLANQILLLHAASASQTEHHIRKIASKRLLILSLDLMMKLSITGSRLVRLGKRAVYSQAISTFQ